MIATNDNYMREKLIGRYQDDGTIEWSTDGKILYYTIATDEPLVDIDAEAALQAIRQSPEPNLSFQQKCIPLRSQTHRRACERLSGCPPMNRGRHWDRKFR